MQNSSLKTALGNKIIYCFINSNFCEPHCKRKCYRKTLWKIWHKGKTIFYLTLTRGEGSVFNKHEFIIL